MIRRIFDSNFVAFLVVAGASASLYLLYSKGRERETLIGIGLLLISIFFFWWGNRRKDDDEYRQPYDDGDPRVSDVKPPRVSPENRKAKKPGFTGRPPESKVPKKKLNDPATDEPNRLRAVERYRRDAGRERGRPMDSHRQKPIARIRIPRSPESEKRVLSTARRRIHGSSDAVGMAAAKNKRVRLR